MRIDKYLKVCRLIRRRTMANEACDGERILINGKVAKPMSEVNPGDILEVHLGRHRLKAKILEPRPYAKKEDAAEMYEIIEDVMI